MMETSKTLKRESKLKLFESDVSGLCNIAGALTFLFLMLYFIIMRSVGLHELFALRDFNFMFLLAGILLALSRYRKTRKSKIEYRTGLKIGMRITLTAVIPFALFIYFYINTDDSFMHVLRIKLYAGEFTAVLGEIISPAIAAGIICAEGLLSGALTTFIAMQYFKK